MKSNNIKNAIKITLGVQKDQRGSKRWYVGYNMKDFIKGVTLCYFPSSSGDVSVYKGASELLVQFKGLLLSQDHGWHSIPGMVLTLFIYF